MSDLRNPVPAFGPPPSAEDVAQMAERALATMPPALLRRSIRYRAMARFGYWFKRNTGEVAFVFRKPA